MSVNIFSLMPCFGRPAPFFLRRESPQNVKNNEVWSPADAAPVAMTIAAIALSRSPLKTTIVARSLPDLGNGLIDLLPGLTDLAADFLRDKGLDLRRLIHVLH